MNRFPAQRGFTLLELLISMALTAMLLGMLSAGVYAVVRDWTRETGVLDETLDQALVILQLDRALQAAYPHSYIDPVRFARFIWFDGQPESLGFVSMVSPQRRAGLTAWRLGYDADRGVTLNLTPAFADNPDTRLQNLDPALLLPGYTLRLRYLSQPDNETKEWLEEWNGAALQSLPRAVHVILEPRNRDSGLERFEFLAPILAWRHDEIEPAMGGTTTLGPPLGIRGISPRGFQ